MTSDRVPYTQAGRMMAISTPLGQATLLLDHLEIDERVNALFEIQAQVKAQRDDLKADDGPWHVDLTWRSWIATCPAYDGAVIAATPLADAADLPTSDENGLAEAA